MEKSISCLVDSSFTKSIMYYFFFLLFSGGIPCEHQRNSLVSGLEIYFHIRSVRNSFTSELPAVLR